MITKEQKKRLGIFVFIATICLLLVLASFIIPLLMDRGKAYTIDFRGISVGGLEKGATVKYQGVRVGAAEQIRVNPSDLNSILVTVRIRRHFDIKADMRAKLMFTGITGLKYIELYGGSNESPRIPPGSLIPTEPGMGEKAEDIVKNIDEAVKRINEVLSPNNQKNIEEFVVQLNKTATVLSEVFQWRRVNLEELLVQLDNASANIEHATAELDQFMVKLNQALPTERLQRIGSDLETSINHLSQRFSENEFGKLIRETDTGVQRISQAIVELKHEIGVAVDLIRDTFDNLRVFTRRLDEDPNILIRKSKRRR
ncbi:MAG: MlaD family protein [Acidobacteriota bacterium]|jgi:phospholipid/cholesterol/gamma-HCH transport system substrate-binding protein|nr:MlaD family protein [Acidobacteriota bacterium]